MSQHTPVLLDEVLSVFAEKPIARFVDGTLGLGGHSAAVVAAHPEAELLGIDRDADAREMARERLPDIHIAAGSFGDLPAHLEAIGWDLVDGVLLDLGVSSMQLDRAEKGFSFSGEAPLDMRMDQTQELTARQIVNEWSEQEILAILHEVPSPDKVARAIVEGRPYSHAGGLGAALKGVARAPRGRKIHPLTLVFQALRIAVNDELGELERGLAAAIDHLRPGGRLAVITFHSLEDRIVKEAFREAAQSYILDPTEPMTGRRPKEAQVKLVTPKPIVPTHEEVKENPRARSAKLRVVERL